MEIGSTARATRQRRASRPKVKTGCNNCKLRRVKCDETRPQCNKCVRSGRHCDGYPAYRRTTDVAIPIAPKPETDSSTSASPPSVSSGSSTPSTSSPPAKRSIIRRPRAALRSINPPTTKAPARVKFVSPTIQTPSGFSFNAEEGQYFQVFRTHTANELSGFFDSEFWTRSVLQQSNSEASIRHAVVALGALYKTLEKASESPPGSPENATAPYDTAPSHYNFALQQYGKALARLREALENKEMRSQRTILISVVLFTCFLSFTGDHRAAIMQIQHGLGLLEERRQDSRQPLIQRKDDVVEDELVQMFTRLAIQAKSYDMAFHFPHPYVIRLSPQSRTDPTSPQSPSSPSDASSVSMESSNIPETFKTSKEARASLDSLCERIMRFTEQLSSYHPGPNNILPKSIRSLGHGYGIQLVQWGAAFAELLETRRTPGITNTERAGINVLKMLHLMISILFVTAFSTSEMGFDNFQDKFREIVDLAKEVVVDEELTLAQARCGDISSCRHTQGRHNQTHHFPGLTSYRPGGYREEDSYVHIKASFALDLGIVPPLFVVATKCRDRKLRRDAIRLLLCSPRREGMWDSILSGRVGQWIMDIEEQGLRPWTRPFDASAREIVPDEQRVMVKTILFNLQNREATISCGTRGLSEGDFDMRAREQRIWW